MTKPAYKDLLNAGVHFGHLTKKWNPKMKPFIFMKQNGIHIIDLNKTIAAMQDVALQLNGMARSGKKILFVATKKQVKSAVEQAAKTLEMPYVTERWLGGTLTNFATMRKLLKRMSSMDKTMQSDGYKSLAKKEQLVIAREQAKLNKVLQGLANTTRLPAALFVVDINKEHVAVQEAQKLGIPVYALVDTNSNPDLVTYLIPGNDDALRSVDIIVRYLTDAMQKGINDHKKAREEAAVKEIEANKATEGSKKSMVKNHTQLVQGVVVKKRAPMPQKNKPITKEVVASKTDKVEVKKSKET